MRKSYKIVILNSTASQKNQTVLIIDDTSCDINVGEYLTDPITEKLNAQFSRVDWQENFDKQIKRANVYPSLFTIKQQQFSNAYQTQNQNSLLKRIHSGIENYLVWREEHTQGMRGITRFSHWFHRQAGITRAKHLKLLTEAALSRFVYSAVIQDDFKSLSNLSDNAYKEIRSDIQV